MKIAVTARDKGSTDVEADSRFGRCRCFAIYNTEKEKWDFIENRSLEASHGAGVQAVQTLTDQGVSVLITGRVGPKAFRGLQQAGIEIYLLEDPGESTVGEALAAYNNSELSQPAGPSSRRHPGRR